MRVHNSEFTVMVGDPRGLDPDDELLTDMLMAASGLERAAETLRLAVSEEMRDRSSRLDNMTEEEYEAWEKATA